MAYHFIAICDCFTDKIAWHYSSQDRLDPSVIHDFMDRFQKIDKAILSGLHRLSTDSTSWQSVVVKDSYFEDIICIEDKCKFIETITM